MTTNPYQQLRPSAFWKTAVADADPYSIKEIYTKKYNIHPDEAIATAGSCFAQHISRHLKQNGYNVLDVEPPPPGLPSSLHQKYGFSTYSARYGNIYTVKQLLQLTREALGEWEPHGWIWEKGGRYYDALRPAVEPAGLDSPEEVSEHRSYHLSKVKYLLQNMDILIYTLGLVESWIHKASGTVFPTAPGTICGSFDNDLHEFHCAQFPEVLRDFNEFQNTLAKIRGGKPFKILLTVSPVPLTATASGQHVLPSTIYAKSTLRSVAGHLYMNQRHVDYFPSYEIVTNPRLCSSSFAENLRTVREDAVTNVMRHFFCEHPPITSQSLPQVAPLDLAKGADVQCEEALLEAFTQ
jgi:hypothetical protein